MERRNLLKTMGGIGAAATVAGAGIGTLSGSAMASGASISAENPARVENDRGDISQVHVDPEFTVSWENLDDGVAKVFYLVEASVGGSGFVPIFRATPWLPAGVENNSYVRAESGTTGEYRLKQPHSMVLNQDPRFSDGSGPDESAGPLIVADEDGKPDYAAADWDSYGPSDLNKYVTTGDVDRAQPPKPTTSSSTIRVSSSRTTIPISMPDTTVQRRTRVPSTTLTTGPDRQRPSNCGTPSNCSGPIADGRSTQLDWAAKPPTRNSLLRFRASKRRTS
jgi:hypothetical protein